MLLSVIKHHHDATFGVTVELCEDVELEDGAARVDAN